MPDDEKPIVRLSTPNTPNDLALFTEEWTKVVTSGITAESHTYSSNHGWVPLENGTLDIGVMRVNPDPQPMDCGCIPEWPEVTPLMREVARLIDDLHKIEGCGVGGPLHIVTDDPNYEDHSLNYCAQATFAEVGPNSQGWWREDQTPDDTQRMVGICLAILWGLSSMSYNERAVAAGYWPLPDDGSRDPHSTYCLGPAQDDYLESVEWGYSFTEWADEDVPEQPVWCCDEHWADTMSMRERRLQPKPCVPVTCPDPVEVRVHTVAPSPLPGEWWTDEFGFRHPAPNPFGLWLPGEP